MFMIQGGTRQCEGCMCIWYMQHHHQLCMHTHAESVCVKVHCSLLTAEGMCGAGGHVL